MQERCFALVLFDFRKPYSSMKRASGTWLIWSEMRLLWQMIDRWPHKKQLLNLITNKVHLFAEFQAAKYEWTLVSNTSDEIDRILRVWTHTFRWGNGQKLILLPTEKWFTLKGKNLLPVKSLLLGHIFFQKVLVHRRGASLCFFFISGKKSLGCNWCDLSDRRLLRQLTIKKSNHSTTKRVCCDLRGCQVWSMPKEGMFLHNRICIQLVLGNGQNFIVDHRLCKTDWSSGPP